ncbi:uncharacterized protein EAF01_008890 [Botrytis porri]|uniref:uncharacterized protein n=1 Tax=Botrytis porri TaxID=87229 RepID=UPI001901885A|nr:uncharacterized protein EAF01_008890 [Botrytis porri]KAF7897924.1 hypothetical protein EAF01_008890 [Botrytis porri]
MMKFSKIVNPYIGLLLVFAARIMAQEPAKLPTNFQYFADEISAAPYLVGFANIHEFHKVRGSITGNAQGTVNVYVNSGATQQPVFVEGVVYNDDYVHVPFRTSGNQQRPQIKPGEVLVEANTEKFWPQGTAYTRREIIQFGCNDNGTGCTTEGFRYRENGDIYNVNEATFNPKGNGHVHAGGAHLDHSLVDGYTTQMLVVPDSKECLPYGCTEEPTGSWCPNTHKVILGDEPNHAGCASDCKIHNTDEACCRGVHNHNQCRASSQHFSNRCKNSYAYAYDDRVGLKFCKEVPDVIYRFFNMDLDCDWAVVDPNTKELTADSRKCLNRLIQALA